MRFRSFLLAPALCLAEESTTDSSQESPGKCNIDNAETEFEQCCDDWQNQAWAHRFLFQPQCESSTNVMKCIQKAQSSNGLDLCATDDIEAKSTRSRFEKAQLELVNLHSHAGCSAKFTGADVVSVDSSLDNCNGPAVIQLEANVQNAELSYQSCYERLHAKADPSDLDSQIQMEKEICTCINDMIDNFLSMYTSSGCIHHISKKLEYESLVVHWKTQKILNNCPMQDSKIVDAEYTQEVEVKPIVATVFFKSDLVVTQSDSHGNMGAAQQKSIDEINAELQRIFAIKFNMPIQQSELKSSAVFGSDRAIDVASENVEKIENENIEDEKQAEKVEQNIEDEEKLLNQAKILEGTLSNELNEQNSDEPEVDQVEKTVDDLKVQAEAIEIVVEEAEKTVIDKNEASTEQMEQIEHAKKTLTDVSEQLEIYKSDIQEMQENLEERTQTSRRLRGSFRKLSEAAAIHMFEVDFLFDCVQNCGVKAEEMRQTAVEAMKVWALEQGLRVEVSALVVQSPDDSEEQVAQSNKILQQMHSTMENQKNESSEHAPSQEDEQETQLEDEISNEQSDADEIIQDAKEEVMEDVKEKEIENATEEVQEETPSEAASSNGKSNSNLWIILGSVLGAIILIGIIVALTIGGSSGSGSGSSYDEGSYTSDESTD